MKSPSTLLLILLINSGNSFSAFESCFPNDKVEKELRQFALFTHRNLGNDIIEGEGDFLVNLIDYFHSQSLVSPSLLELRQLLYENKESYQFASAIMDLYHSAEVSKEKNIPCFNPN